MIRHDDRELNFCLLLADKLAPKILFVDEDSCLPFVVIVDELIVAPEGELDCLF